MLNVEGTVKEMQAEGTIVEEVTPMENLSLRIMSLLGHHKALFKMITRTTQHKRKLPMYARMANLFHTL